MRTLLIACLLVARCALAQLDDVAFVGSLVTTQSAPSWSPTNTASSGPAVAWWSVHGNYSTNAGVASLSDSTGNGFTVTNAGAAGGFPIRRTANLNSLDTISFISGSSSYLQTKDSALNYAQPLDVFLVAAITNTTDSGRRFMFCSTNSSAYFAMSLYPNGGGNELYAGTFAASASPLTNKWAVFHGHYSGAASYIRTNNVPGATVNPNVLRLSGIVMGARYDLNFFGSFGLAEMCIFTNLAAADITNCFDYLTNKYALSP